MEEQKEERYFHYENIGKNVYTTIAGCILIFLSIAAVVMNWFFPNKAPQIPWSGILGVGIAGFILLFLRDNAKSYVDLFIRKKIDSAK